MEYIHRDHQNSEHANHFQQSLVNGVDSIGQVSRHVQVNIFLFLEEDDYFAVEVDHRDDSSCDSEHVQADERLVHEKALDSALIFEGVRVRRNQPERNDHDQDEPQANLQRSIERSTDSKVTLVRDEHQNSLGDYMRKYKKN